MFRTKLKRLLAMGMALLMVSSFMTISSLAAYSRTYTAPKGTPVIDGIADEIWNSAEWTDVDKPYDGTDKSTYPEQMKIKLLWDEKFLYFYAVVKDADINFENDIVELYIDEDASFAEAYDENDSQTRFRSDGTVVTDSGANCKNDSVAVGTATSDGFVVEGSLAWTGKVKCGEGSILGLEFMYSIGDSSADFTQAFRWNVDTAAGDAAPWQSPKAWGKLTLGAAPAVAQTEAPTIESTTDKVDEAPVAPKTFDIMLILCMSALAASVAFIAIKRKGNNI